ncbi:OB-fold nucleic acid binding domain-containing protein [Halobacteria archaeon AArc-dxtr1]|nr:OB-fold nucleic acid binding domain-containing protein [Halobacteria archaeon AArc-dxtr1]
MGNCIICGTSVDGFVCGVHEEDVAFDFRGNSASQLTPDRYYRGTVDGYADFGVFVDIGDHVTGLLHRSKLDQRLESLDWEPGDTVFVQVLSVRDNGNVDLGWSIRQRERDFRGDLVDTGSEDRLPEDEEEAEATSNAPSRRSQESESSDADETDSDASSDDASSETVAADVTDSDAAADESDQTAANGGNTAVQAVPETTDDTVESADDADDEPALNRTTVDAIDSQVGTVVRLEGEITSVRQTAGPTVFELRDETGTVEVAAFEEAGVRAYPDAETGNEIAVEGEVERHYGDLQVETETLEILDDEDAATVRDRLEQSLESAAKPKDASLLADHDAVAAVSDDLVDAATAIRRAVIETRPIVIRHSATADGYVAGAAIERAVLPLVREKHTREDAAYHYVERRPLDGRVYDMDAATNDVTSMLEARDRHDEQLPLVVLVDSGSTAESVDGYELLSLYGADAIVVDDSRADAAITDTVSLTVAPSLADVDVSELTTTALAATLAGLVDADSRDDLVHLPAVSYWEDTPDVYRELAADAGYDETALAERREAVALEAYYQSYKDKRELVGDLLFGDESSPSRDGDLAAHVSEQFRDKLEAELETARRNADTETVGDLSAVVLDTGEFTHRYDFPTTDLLLDALHRDQRDDEPFATIGVDTDELRVRATEPVDVRDLGDAIAEAVPDAGVRVVGGHDGHVEFLSGEREAVREAALDALGEILG